MRCATARSSDNGVMTVTSSRELARAPVAGCIALETARYLSARNGREPVAVLAVERRVERHAPLLVGAETVAAQCRLRTGGDLARERQCLRQRSTRRDEAVRDAHAQRLFARDAAPGEDHIERVAVADQPGE